MKDKQSAKTRSANLLIHCPDRKGIVAAVTEFIGANAGNILDLIQHVDRQKQVFFMRVEWDLADFRIPRGQIGPSFEQALAQRYQMGWKLHFSDDRQRMAVFVSRHAHCLYDILARVQSGEWSVEIPLVVSNHPDLEPIVARQGIPFHVIPITKETKKEQEEKELQLLKQHQVDFIVLARYMQILTEQFVARYPSRIINIHHSFLPAFPGARPYHSAYERGVKVIGATSHYVTADLDAGPIIEQDVVHVSHRDDVRDLIRKGRDLEKVVLSRAIWHHIGRRVLVYDNRTVVFE